ncbi:hypothetical protein B484DRAFT_352975, partial [Ochromonadaceae sp. CCMP2298]
MLPATLLARMRLLLVLVCLQRLWVDGGIVGLSKFLRSNYKASWCKDVAKAAPISADHVCIDMNQVLHSCFRASRKPDHIMAKIFINLDSILRIAAPQKSLVLAFDGPAPFAKLQTQRKRRRSHPESSLITPGTDFMNSMENVMLCYVLQRIRKPNFSNVTVFISDATCPGEGELKIIDWVRRQMPQAEALVPTETQIQIQWTQMQMQMQGQGQGQGQGQVQGQWQTTPETRTHLTQQYVDAARVSNGDSVLICGSDSDIIVQSVCMGSLSPRTLVLQMGSDGPDALCNVSSLLTQLVATTGIDWQAMLQMHDPEYHQQLLEEGGGTGTGADEGTGAETGAGAGAGSAGAKKGKNFLHSLSNPVRATFGNSTGRLHPISNLRSVHLDLVVLFALQGNDYLPKLRGTSTTRALAVYGQTMKQLAPEERYLVDQRHNTYNFKALWLLTKMLRESTDRGGVPLPVPVPTAAGHLHILLQRSRSASKPAKGSAESRARLKARQMRVEEDGGEEGEDSTSASTSVSITDELVWDDVHIPPSVRTSHLLRALLAQNAHNASYLLDMSEVCSLLEQDSLRPGKVTPQYVVMPCGENVTIAGQRGYFARGVWSTSVSVLGKLYTSRAVATSKKGARQRLCEDVIRDKDPEHFNHYVLSRDAAVKQLKSMRAAAYREAQERDGVVDLVPDGVVEGVEGKE